MQPMKKVAFYTLGCKLNLTDTNSIAKEFEKEGYEVTDFLSDPDVFVINTCSVTDNADKKCRKIVKEAKRINKDSEVIVVGCYAQLKPEEISKIPGVTGVFGTEQKFEILKHLNSQESIAKGSIEKLEFVPAYSGEERTRLFFKVQDGCNYKCSFCTIPLARGKSRSTNSSDLVKLAEEAVLENGSKEIILTGVNIGDFGIIEGRRKEKLIDLLRKMEESPILPRIRISSIEPNLLSDEIIEFASKSKKIVPHFHIPLQSGSDKILTEMKRRYRRDLYKTRVEKIKMLIPDACIGVDVIVGFPGEGMEEFSETYHFLESLPISYLHVFPYSERANTVAPKLEGKVSPKERTRRADNLRELSERKKKEFYLTQVGTSRTVVYEALNKNGKMLGFTENYIRIEADYDPQEINELKSIKVGEISDQLIAQAKEIPQPNKFF